MKCSASSFETFHDDCPRKWWWKEMRDMPEGKEIAGSAFGTALHGVNERWRRADDRGNFPAGIELYPAGWNKGLDAAETQLVKMLHEKAVEQGILVRRAGRKPEEWMNTPTIIGDDVVSLTGKLDCEDNEGFEDDKSTSAQKWAKDEAGLASDSAMLFYAVEWCRRHADAIQCRMRYNYFLKDASAPKVWPVEAIVTREVVDHFREQELMPTVAAMAAIAEQNFADEDWEKVEGPRTQDACRKFKGCPYATICGRVEQPAQYRARVARILSNRSKEPMGVFAKKGAAAPAPAPAAAPAPAPTSPPPATVPAANTSTAPAASATAQKPVGGIFAKKNTTPAAAAPAQAPAAPAAAPAAPPSAPAPAPAPTAAPAAAAPQTVTQAPPWAHPACRSCKGTGMHPTEKRPCKGCRSAKMVQKLPTDEQFDISYDAAGNLVWKAKDGVTLPAEAASAGSTPAIAAVATPTQAPTPVVTEPVEKPKAGKPRGRRQPEVAADVAPAPAPEPEAPKTVEVTLPPAPEKVLGPAPAPTLDAAFEAQLWEERRKDLPLILLCGASPEKLPPYYKAASMGDVFAEAAALVAEATGKDFWTINAFERRDALSKMAPQLAARLAGHVVIAPRSGPDQEALVQALKPHAGLVFLGLN